MASDPGLSIRLNDPGRSIQVLDSWAGVLRRIPNRTIRIQSRLPYAYGIEFGFKRSGALARRAGPAYYMTTARNRILRAAPTELGSAWLRGPDAVEDAWKGLAIEGQRIARQVVPVVSGQLQGSVEAWVGNARVA